MAITKEQEARILRFHHVEKWRVGTIARQLGTTPWHGGSGVVAGGLAEGGSRPSAITCSILCLPFIVETLKQYPTLTASRLYAMVRERGYEGGPDHFRHLMAHYRPRRSPRPIFD